MQRSIALFVIAIALTPNVGNGAELGVGDLKPNSGQHAENFDGAYFDEPARIAEHKLSKNTEKIMTYMARAGLDSTGVKTITYFVNDHIEDNNFNITSGRYEGFKMQFSHEVSIPSANKFKLRLTNEEVPHWGLTGTTKGVMLNYHLEW